MGGGAREWSEGVERGSGRVMVGPMSEGSERRGG
jgi:hypothetical protein